MYCRTIKGYDDFGLPVYKSKKQYNTLDEAIAEARFINSKSTTICKVVPYKCPECFKFHLGRNGSILTTKQREKNLLFRKLHI